MAYIFTESWDPYTAVTDAAAGYWDSQNTSGFSLQPGRFAGGQCLQLGTAGGFHTKSSGVNDAVHHITIAFRQTTALSGTTTASYISLYDGATAQCTIVFRSDGAILLTSGGPGGATLDTYTGAVTLQNQWFAFEFEVVINGTTGSWTARKNGSTSNDHFLGSLNTRTTANNYANALRVGENTTFSTQQHDDLIWRSDASSVAWVGDVRCYTRMPASDQSVQFSRLSSITTAPGTLSANNNLSATTAFYAPVTAGYTGTVGTVTVLCGTGYTGNMKCAIFSSSGSNPVAVLASATTLTNPITGTNTLTFPTPLAVTQGTQYWIGIEADTSVTNGISVIAGSTGKVSTTAYAAFPAASPTTSNNSALIFTWTITFTANNQMVSEAQQDGATTYVYSSNVGDADFYGIAPIAVTPAAVVAVTTRGFLQKSDAGSRSGGVQLKSGGTTVSATGTASTSWQWHWRTDVTDPATGSAWTAVSVNNIQVGPVITA